MSVPVWMLLGFATWTLLLLMFTVGTHRWSHILSGRRQISGFRADPIDEADWYKRATRAHANCIENLPVFGAIVAALHIANVSNPWCDALAVAILIARVSQSLVHVGFVQTNTAVSLRFSLYCVQAVGFLGLIGIVVMSAGASS